MVRRNFYNFSMMKDFYTWYAPRKGFRQTWLFLVVFALFPAMGVFALLSGQTAGGIAALVFGGICYAFIIGGAAAWGCRYGIGEKTIFLKRSTSKRVLRFEEISSVSPLSREQSSEFMNKLQHPAIEAERAINFSEWYRVSKQWGEVSRFVSVPQVSSITSRGSRRNITSAKVLPVGELLLLRLESGEGLLITPRDPEIFLDDLTRQGVEEAPFSFEEMKNYVAPADQEKLGRSHRRWRTYMRVNLIIILPLVTLFIFRGPLIDLLPEEVQNHPVIRRIYTLGTDDQPEEPLPGEPILRETAAFIDENSFVFGVSLDELTAEQRAGDLSLGFIMDHGVPLMLRILERNGTLPEIEDSWERSVTISQILYTQGALSTVEDREWNGLIHRFYLIEMDGLKDVVNSLAADF